MAVAGVITTTKDIYFLDSKYRDPSRDCDYSNILDDGKKHTIGDYPYHCPYGWKFIGIKVQGKYPEDTREWPVTYHGTKSPLFNKICSEGYRIGPGNRYGSGIYSCPLIEHVTGYAPKFSFEGANYIGVLQNKVNPKAVSIQCTGNIWVCPNPANIMPYGLCVKKVD